MDRSGRLLRAGHYLSCRTLSSVQRQAQDGHSSIALLPHKGEQGCLAVAAAHSCSIRGSGSLQRQHSSQRFLNLRQVSQLEQNHCDCQHQGCAFQSWWAWTACADPATCTELTTTVPQTLQAVMTQRHRAAEERSSCTCFSAPAPLREREVLGESAVARAGGCTACCTRV